MIYVLTASLLILTIIVIAIAIHSQFRVWIMALLIPFLIFNIGFSYHTIKELWGYPVEESPKTEVELLSYKIAQPNIFLMVRQPDGRVRLYQIPYTKKTEEELKGAGQAMKKGQRIMMKNHGRQDQESKVEFYSWKPEEHFPKEIQ